MVLWLRRGLLIVEKFVVVFFLFSSTAKKGDQDQKVQ